MIDSAQVAIKGGVDNFTLGPLSVRGTTGPRATVDCDVGVTKQSLLIDGMVELFDAQAVTHIDVEVLPSPKFTWYTSVSLSLSPTSRHLAHKVLIRLGTCILRTS